MCVCMCVCERLKTTTRNIESLLGDNVSLKVGHNLAESIAFQKDRCFRISEKAFRSS